MAHPHGKHADFESLRGQAVRLRRQGYSIRQIRDELKIFDNDILQRLVQGEPPPAWTRRPNAKDDLRERARELRLQGWTYDRIGAELGCSKSSVSLWVRDLPTPVGELSDRELFFTGVALYWAEGAKDKPHRRTEVLQFINSDPNVIRLFLHWLEFLGVQRERLTLRVSIHESADVESAEKFWADIAGFTYGRAPICTVAWRAPGTA
jgi:transcriptional regulator with XRE-family HTH domain